jgi:hypothetical protein
MDIDLCTLCKHGREKIYHAFCACGRADEHVHVIKKETTPLSKNIPTLFVPKKNRLVL